MEAATYAQSQTARHYAAWPADRPSQVDTRDCKPRYQPPPQVFPVVLTLLYSDIAVTSAATIDLLNAGQ